MPCGYKECRIAVAQIEHIGYLAELATLYIEREVRQQEVTEGERQQLLRSVNRAIGSHYQDEPTFDSWRELCAVVLTESGQRYANWAASERNDQMLKRIYIDNFRCLVNLELLFSEINLFLGPNGSGKSTVGLKCGSSGISVEI